MLDPNRPAFRILLGGLSMVSALAVDMSLPAMPLLVTSFQASAASVQLTVSLYLIGYAAGQLFYGPLSDRFGRRPMLLIGMSIYGLAAFSCTVAPSIETMVTLRLLQGFGGCVGVVVTRAAARDYFHGTGLAQLMSSITTVQAFGPLVAPVIGGLLVTHLDWRAIFLVQGSFALALLIATWKGFAESLPRGNPHALKPRHLLTNYWVFLSTRRCIGFALVSACVFSGLFIVLSASPFVLIEVYGISSQTYGFFFGASVLGYMIGAFFNRRLLERGTLSETLLRRGLVLLLIAGAFLLGGTVTRWGGTFGIMVPYFFYCIAVALVQSNSIAAAMEPVPHMAGTGASLMGAIQMSSAAAGGFVVDLLFNETGIPMGLGVAAAAIAASAAYYLVARR